MRERKRTTSLAEEKLSQELVPRKLLWRSGSAAGAIWEEPKHLQKQPLLGTIIHVTYKTLKAGLEDVSAERGSTCPVKSA